MAIASEFSFIWRFKDKGIHELSPMFVFLHEFSPRPWLGCMKSLSKKNKLICKWSSRINTFIYTYLCLENLIFVDSRTSFHQFETRHLFTLKVPYLENTISVGKSFHGTAVTNSERVISPSCNWVNWSSRNFSFTSTSLLCWSSYSNERKILFH